MEFTQADLPALNAAEGVIQGWIANTEEGILRTTNGMTKAILQDALEEYEKELELCRVVKERVLSVTH